MIPVPGDLRPPLAAESFITASINPDRHDDDRDALEVELALDGEDRVVVKTAVVKGLL
jgi:hypothetical protein